MADLTKYIESLLDEVKDTLEVNYINNIYEVIIVRDYRNSVVKYKDSVNYNYIMVFYIKKILKSYLPESLYLVKVMEINIPIGFIPLHYTG
jgi:hypothetical protein